MVTFLFGPVRFAGTLSVPPFYEFDAHLALPLPFRSRAAALARILGILRGLHFHRYALRPGSLVFWVPKVARCSVCWAMELEDGVGLLGDTCNA